jgi:hypothetical protein
MCGSQTDIAGAHGVAPLVLEVIEKAQYGRGIDIGNVQRRGFNAGCVSQKRQP